MKIMQTFQQSLNQAQITETSKRWKSRVNFREKNNELISQRRFFDIDSPERVKKFLIRRGYDSRQVNEIMKEPVGYPPSLLKPDFGVRIGLERIMGSNDLVPVYYLVEGITKASSVGRIWIRNANNMVEGYGTGSLISKSLLLTNNHVLPDSNVAQNALVEFNYQLNLQNQMEPSEIFALDPDTFYVTDEYLDYTIVAVQSQNKKGVKPGSFGWNPLIEEEGKAIISQWVSIIQHPNGDPKQIGMRENQIIDMLPDFIHYTTDTCPGSSGSPVYNDRWEIVALHHSGVPSRNKAGNYLTDDGKIWNPGMGEDKIKWIGNEGIRISKILKNIRTKELSSHQINLLDETQESPVHVLSPVKPSKDENEPVRMTDMTMNRSNNGTASWTIPLVVTVNLGNNEVTGKAINSHIPPDSQNSSASQTTTPNIWNENGLLNLARQEFSKRQDVLKVELGYKFRNGWITNERCIVITVLKRKTIKQLMSENDSPISNKIGNYEIDVVGPTINDLISYQYGQDRLESLVPPSGISTEEIRYQNPPGLSLTKTIDTMRVIAHISPEKGWEYLQPFLKSSANSLTIAMYDFGAPHILNEIKSINSRNFKELMIVMQPGSDVGKGTKKDDYNDEDALIELSKTFKSKLKNAWVNRGKINGWISSSYHIKVAVADHKKFWLSSGNWQSSNQPDLNTDGLKGKDQKYLLKNYNRDWHIIIEHSGLAKTFEDYIKYDFANNKQTLSPDEAILIKELNFVIPEQVQVISEEKNIPVEAFDSFIDKRKFTVTPILSPDNYFEVVLKLIKSAQSKLYIQNQTFNAPGESQAKLKELIDAVIEKQNAGVDVKIIFRSYIPAQARENITNLKEMGMDVNCIKLDNYCHTKGIMVDGSKVLIGSQNISNDGISVNRDASLLFEDKSLTGYFEKIFLHDYTRAVQNIGNESTGIEILNEGDKIPENSKKITWSEALELL